MPEFARFINAMPCSLVSEVHLAFLQAVELQSSDCCCVVTDFPVVFTVSIIVI